jgi:predicted AAA+ superfamily ATPase
MPVHIEEMTSEITIVEGELPMTPAQIERLVKLVMKRIADKQKEEEKSHAATKLKRQASRPFEPGS